MKVILSNGTELESIIVNGLRRNIQGTSRDCLSFVFPETVGLEELDAIFTESACESITLVENEETSYIYKGYTIRTELKKETVAVTTGDAETDTVYENRITVTMAQRTYAESKLVKLESESTDTQLAVAELAEIIMGGTE